MKRKVRREITGNFRGVDLVQLLKILVILRAVCNENEAETRMFLDPEEQDKDWERLIWMIEKKKNTRQTQQFLQQNTAW